MADETHDLSVGFRVDLEGLTAGLEKAHEAIKGVGEKMSEGFHKVGETLLSLTNPANLLRGFIAGELVSAFGEMVYASLESVEALAKLSDRLGVSTEGMAGLQFAATQAGVPLDALTAAFRTSERVISAAADGNQKAAGAFQELGLSLSDLRKLNPEDQFSKIAEAISKVENATDRARLVQEVYGRSGSVILPMLLKGEEGLLEKKKEAAEFGLAVSREDAAKAELAVESIKKIGAAWEGIKNTISIAIAPYIAAIGDAFSALLKPSSDFKAKVEEVVDAIADGFYFAADVVGGLYEAIGQVKDGLIVLFDKVVDFVQPWLDVADAFYGFSDGASKDLANLKFMLEHSYAAVDMLRAGFGELSVWMTDWFLVAVDRIQILGQILGNFGDAIKQTFTAMGAGFANIWDSIKGGLGEALVFIERQMSSMLDKMADGLQHIKGMSAVADEVKAAATSMLISAQQFEDGMAKSSKAASDEAKTAGEAMVTAWKTVGQTDIKANPFEWMRGNARQYADDTLKIYIDALNSQTPPGEMLRVKMHAAMTAIAADADETGKRVAESLKPPSAKMSDGEAEKHLAQLNKDLGDETSAENAAYDKRLANLKALHDAQRMSDEEYAADKAKLESHHEGTLFDIHNKARLNEAAVETKYRQALMTGTAQMFGNLATLMQSHHREQFEVGKAAAIAQTTINTAQAAMGAYSAMAGIPYVGPFLGIAAAAAAVAAGAIQISNIQSTSFGGGGSTGGSFGSGPSGAGPGTPSGGAPTNGVPATPDAGTTVNIHLPPDSAMLTVGSVRSLIDSINQVGADGTKISRIAIAS